MNPSKPSEQGKLTEEWTRRRKANVQLGLAFGALAIVLFLLALWKYRPL